MAKVWTDAKLKLLREKFGAVPDADLAAELGVTERALALKTKALGLKPKPPEEAKKKVERANGAILGGEKTVKIGGEEHEMIPSGLVIKTEQGWEQVMIRKTRVSNK